MIKPFEYLPFLGEKTFLVDLFFCLMPFFILYQWLVRDNPVNAVGMAAIGFFLFAIRPLIKPPYMATVISRKDVEKLASGETVTMTIFNTTVVLAPETSDE